MPRIAVVDYGIGNLRSAEKAMQRVGADARLTTSPADIAAADAVVLPGVGHFGRCIDALHESGLDQPTRDAAASGRPFLGICVGMQMLLTRVTRVRATRGSASCRGGSSCCPSRSSARRCSGTRSG